ncbi:hypothetical protein M7I_3268 [Glarea lozoyensis 74030]|uniref:Uncharacterized protein n=1 Tax=Glarea lozoyensis (strain ATCC 74030 / MF5533) TaxID=1104152 RepID=H0EL32_GLAL7|nr:hypothetical protein M7I_3268 [Glarea lozoyensis 74030]
MAAPTLINMPEPPSNPETPTEMPGTPNSTTTSLSALSTTAIKDGHRGTSATAGQIPGYFDPNGNPVYTTKMSTVGSASATGSIGGRTTTWASGSAKASRDGDDDEMSVDNMEADRFSASAMDEDMDQDGMSDNTSLVGFGEGAGSTVSGPTYNRRDIASPGMGKSALAMQLQSGSGTPGSSSRDARMMDGTGDDGPGSSFVDTTTRDARGGPARNPGVEAAERILRDRLDEGEGKKPLGSPDEAGLGKFYFEEKK